VPVGHAKFHMKRCNESPRAEKPDLQPLGKFNTGSLRNPAVKNRQKSAEKSVRTASYRYLTNSKKIHRSTLEQGTYEKIKQLLDDKTKNKDYTVVMWDLKGVVGEGNNMDMSAIMVWDIIMIVDRC